MFPPPDRLWQEFSETASPRCEEAVIGHCGTSGPGCHDVKHRDVGEIRKKGSRRFGFIRARRRYKERDHRQEDVTSAQSD